MACGCGKRKTAPSSPAPRISSRGSVWIVWLNGVSTGRRFTSAVAAQAYADRIGGEVRAE